LNTVARMAIQCLRQTTPGKQAAITGLPVYSESMGEQLAGQVVLITGAGSGIGAEIARRVSATGATAVLCGRTIQTLREVASSLPGPSKCIACDVVDFEQVKAMVQATLGELGKIDIVVNNAGAFDLKSIEDTSMELFDKIIGANLRGAFAVSKAAWPHLRASKGQVLNVSSIAGARGFNNCSAYCASKHGMNGLSAALEMEGKPFGIRILTICPASIDTDLWGDNADRRERDRMMSAGEVAEACIWMLTRPRNVQVERLTLDNYKSPFGD